MRKLALWVAAIVLIISFAQEGYAAGREGADKTASPAKRSEGVNKTAISGSYIKEVFTSTPPAAGVSFNSAVKIFRVGDTIDYVTRHFLSPVANFSIYMVISNPAGQVIGVLGEQFTVEQGSGSDRVYGWSSADFSTQPGTYYLNTLMFTNSGAILISPTGFSYIVE